jgi:hypothetical protein
MKILYLFKFSMEQIKKHKFIFIILAILIFACGAVLNYLISLVKDCGFEYNFMNRFRNKEMLYVSTLNKLNFDEMTSETDVDAYYKKIEENNKLSWEVFGKLSADQDIEAGTLIDYMINVNKAKYKIYVYNNILRDNTVFYLKEGRQLYEFKDKDSKYVPVLIAEENPLLKKYGVGDVITISATEQITDENHNIIEEKEYSYAAVIWGIISKPFKYFISGGFPDRMISMVSDILNINSEFYNDPYNTDHEFIITPEVTFEDGTGLSELNIAKINICIFPV